MARRVQGPPPGHEDWYTPVAYGNDKAPEPVKVYLRFPTESDKRYAAAQATRLDVEALRGAKTELDVLALSVGSAVAMQEVLIEQCVLKVQNYENAAGDAIKDGKDFAKHGEDLFVREVGDVLLKGIALTKAEKKTSDASSVSPGSKSPSAGTTAVPAVGADAPKAQSPGKDGDTSQASDS